MNLQFNTKAGIDYSTNFEKDNNESYKFSSIANNLIAKKYEEQIQQLTKSEYKPSIEQMKSMS